MNESEHKAQEEKTNLRNQVTAAALGTALQSFRYFYRLPGMSKPQNLPILENQVAKAFHIGREIGEKIGRGEL